MTKLIFFLPIILFFGFFLLLIAGFFFLIFKLIAKSKGESWQGEVIDKKEFSRKDDDTKRIEHFHHLVVRTNDGKERKVACHSKCIISSQSVTR